MAATASDWYYQNEFGEEVGPLSLIQLKAALRQYSDTDAATCYVWHASLENWRAAQDVPDLQSFLRGPAAVAQQHDWDNFRTRAKRASEAGGRKAVVEELVATEKKYVEKMHILEQLFVEPLRSAAEPFASDQDLDVLFRDVTSLSQLSGTMLKDLGAILSSWRGDGEGVGAALLAFVPFIKMYTRFVVTTDKANNTLSHLKLNARFRDFVENAEAYTNCKGYSLYELLQAPAVRPQELMELVQQLARCTPQAHADHAQAHAALAALEASIQHIEEAQAHEVNQRLIREIEAKFIKNPGFFAPARVLVNQGQLLKQCRTGNKMRQVFLFNDMLCYAIRTGWKLALRSSFPIDGSLLVADAPEEPSGVAFKVLTPSKSFYMYAQTPQSKQRWLDDIGRCIKEQSQKVGQRSARLSMESMAPVYQQNAKIDQCPLCEAQFDLLRNRKKSCKSCGVVCCADCSTARLLLHGQEDLGPRRVCDTCNAKLGRGEKISRQMFSPTSIPSPIAAAAGGGGGGSGGGGADDGLTVTGDEKQPACESPLGLRFSCVKTETLMDEKTGKDFMGYYLRIQGPEGVVDKTLPKRYAQLLEFDKAFRRDFPNIPYHLPKAVIFGTRSALVIQERASAFVSYLAGISTVRALWEPLGTFWEFEEDEWKRFGKRLERAQRQPAPSPVAADGPTAVTQVRVLNHAADTRVLPPRPRIAAPMVPDNKRPKKKK